MAGKRNKSSGTSPLLMMCCGVFSVFMVAAILVIAYRMVLSMQTEAWVRAYSAANVISQQQQDVSPQPSMPATGTDALPDVTGPVDGSGGSGPVVPDGTSSGDVSSGTHGGSDALGGPGGSSETDGMPDGGDDWADLGLDPVPETGDPDASSDAIQPSGYDWGNVDGCSLSPDGVWVYTVKRGDTLCRISKLLGFSVDEIADLNHIADVNRIYVGESIVIPVPRGFHG